LSLVFFISLTKNQKQKTINYSKKERFQGFLSLTKLCTALF